MRLLIMLGLVTSSRRSSPSGEMAVAYFVIHQPLGALPNRKHGERARYFPGADRGLFRAAGFEGRQ